MTDGGLTFKRDVINTNTRNGEHHIVEALSCGYCHSTTWKVVYYKGLAHAFLYCTRCRTTFVNEIGGNNDH